ncbi:MAG: hypothetical protein AB7R89_28765 [Dehalococcoidia bacterium]
MAVKLVQFTMQNDQTIWVNPEQVIAVEHEGDGAVLTTAGLGIHVTEPPELVVKKLQGQWPPKPGVVQGDSAG